MDLTEQLRAFVATAQAGSFTGGAEQLGVSNRLTSKYVAALEDRLGVRLLQRTTRRVGLTPAGADLLARAPAILEDFDEMLAELAAGGRGLTGLIRISAPVTLGEVWTGAMLGRFGARHPGLSFDLRLTDRFVDLAGEGVDLAFRIGKSQISSLKQRRLGVARSVLVASLDYVAAHGAPARPSDLARHACIIDTNRTNPRRWALREAGAPVVVEVDGRFAVNSARAAVELAMAGQGIAMVPHFALAALPGAQQLSRLLQGHEPDPAPLHATYLEGRQLPRKIRALIDFAAEDLREANLI